MSAPDSAHESLVVRQELLVATLSRFRDPQARLAWTVEQARLRPHLPDALRRDVFRVEGCQVRLWLVPDFRAARCWFQTDSDAATLRSLCGILCDLASGATPAELAGWRPEFLDRLGLVRLLAENRRATVWRVAEQIRMYAAERQANDG